MKPSVFLSLTVFSLALACGPVQAADWPQWRGLNRDAKAPDFKAPTTWPAELKEKWKVTVGDGVATPALVGERLYVFSRQDGNEIIRCLNAEDGKELWQDKYEAQGASGPASGFSGPRSSPAVAQGKVVTYGVRGTLSCLDASSGKKLWRKEDPTGKVPRFFTSASPLISADLFIIQLGGEEAGRISAFDLSSGDEKWNWEGDGSAYASPTLRKMSSGPAEVIALTAKKIVGLAVADGKLVWELPFVAQGRAYNAATPIIEGDILIVSGAGRGTKAFKLQPQGPPKELWSNGEQAVQFNTPVMEGQALYGIAQSGDLFCLDAGDGSTRWTYKLGGRGFGSVVDANTVLMALTPQSELLVFAPNEKEFKQLASYKVGTDTHAYPIPSGTGIYIKDKESVAFFTF